MRNKFLFFIVLGVCIIPPFNNDVYLSVLPTLAKLFQSQNVAMIMSYGLLGLAISQPLYGPLSDRFGRKPILMVGLVIFTVASAAIIFTNSFSALLIARLIQGIGACSTLISALAIVRDTYDKEDIVRATSMIMAIIGVCPAIGPMLGSFLNHTWGWRASFVFLFALGVFYLVWIGLFFKETHQKGNRQSLAISNIIYNYKTLLKNKRFLSYCMTAALAYSVLFSYINISAYFIMQQMHFSMINYGLILSLNAIAILVTAILAPSLAKRISLETTMLIGTGLITAGGVLLWTINTVFTASIITFMLPIFISTIGIGFIRPTGSSGAMRAANAKISGTAAALFSFLAFSLSAIVVTLSARYILTLNDFGVLIIILGIGSSLFAMGAKPKTIMTKGGASNGIKLAAR